MTVVSVLRLAVRPGSGRALARAFAELGVFERSRESGGFRGGRVLLPHAGEQVLVVAEWECEDDYERWLAHPVREELKEGLEPFLSEEVGPGRLYKEGHAG